jgi:hypothetical protein
MIRLFVMLCVAVLTASYGDEARIVRGGKTLAEPAGPTLVTNVIRFLASSSYQSTAYAVSSNTWQDLLKSNSFVHVKLDPPRRMNLWGLPPADRTKRAGREEVMINEIVVPLLEEHEPPHIYARAGTNIVSHTKFQPIAFKRLIQEPALKLRDSKVYREYSRLPEAEGKQESRRAKMKWGAGGTNNGTDIGSSASRSAATVRWV